MSSTNAKARGLRLNKTLKAITRRNSKIPSIPKIHQKSVNLAANPNQSDLLKKSRSQVGSLSSQKPSKRQKDEKLQPISLLNFAKVSKPKNGTNTAKSRPEGTTQSFSLPKTLKERLTGRSLNKRKNSSKTPKKAILGTSQTEESLRKRLLIPRKALKLKVPKLKEMSPAAKRLRNRIFKPILALVSLKKQLRVAAALQKTLEMDENRNKKISFSSKKTSYTKKFYTNQNPPQSLSMSIRLPETPNKSKILSRSEALKKRVKNNFLVKEMEKLSSNLTALDGRDRLSLALKDLKKDKYLGEDDEVKTKKRKEKRRKQLILETSGDLDTLREMIQRAKDLVDSETVADRIKEYLGLKLLKPGFPKSITFYYDLEALLAVDIYERFFPAFITWENDSEEFEFYCSFDGSKPTQEVCEVSGRGSSFLVNLPAPYSADGVENGMMKVKGAFLLVCIKASKEMRTAFSISFTSE